MPSLKIMTFNVENLLARFRFREWEKRRLATLPVIESEVDRANLILNYWNILHDETRSFTALTIKEGAPEVICLQEVENMHALRTFHDNYLRRISGHDYNYMILIDANDPRGIDVAVLSRYRIVSAATHQNKLKGGQRIFRRDCLEVHVKKQNKTLPIFVCHFKSMSGGRNATKKIREAEAQAVREIIEESFGDPSKSDWVVVGDLNDYTERDGKPDKNHALDALFKNNFSVDLVKKNIKNVLDRWTHYYPGEDSYSQLDYILLSPSLYKKNNKVKPKIIRKGQPFRANRYAGERWPRVGYDRPKASDHCPVGVTLKY